MLLRLLCFSAALLLMASAHSQDLNSAETDKSGSQKTPAHPDWLSTQDIKSLLSGNTITALSDSGSSRWWTFYLEDGSMYWVNDLGKNAFGIWYIAQDQLCEVWKKGEEKCWSIRFTGKVVRFDDSFTGKPYAAAVLQTGDSRNLRAKVTPEIQEALRELRESGLSSAVIEGDPVSVARLETGTIDATGERRDRKPLKLRIVHPDVETANDLIEALSGVELAGANERADLVWDVIRGEIARDDGIIAYPRTDEPSEIQLVVAASNLIDDIKELGLERADGLSLQILPEQEFYKAGETITLTLSNFEGEHALLFNVGPYGDIDIIYPIETDFGGDDAAWPRISSARPLSISAVAGPPFGENLVVGVVSSAEPRVLLKTLRYGGGPAGISAFLKALRETEGQIDTSSFRIHR